MNEEISELKHYMRTDYTRYLMAFYCMPTLLKLKPSSLISVDKSFIDKTELIKKVQSETDQFDCKYDILYEDNSMLNLFVYQEQAFASMLSDYNNIRFLMQFGYDCNSDRLDHIIHSLKTRMDLYHNGIAKHINTEFPHEIGIILGYPVEDVDSFIRYQGKNYLYSGYWKVYHNVNEAVRIFENYRELRQAALRVLVSGKNLKEVKNINHNYLL